MVLGTAYDQLHGLEEAMLARGIDADRVVGARAEKKFTTQKADFESRHRAGVRPVLLGLGTAWTGVNFVDESAQPGDDFLLTDLVILRLPLGLNRTTAMTSRIDRMGMYPIINEALIILKQGLGRLIRRDGLTDRRLWVLDGRIWQPWPGMEPLTGAVRQMLSDYDRRRCF
jgi:ATP-dependent DNA helicase DinG